MLRRTTKPCAILLISLLLLPSLASLGIFKADLVPDAYIQRNSNSYLSSYLGEPLPLRKATFVNPNSSSLIDEFAYMAAIPTAVFNHAGQQYISPLIYSKLGDSERWLTEDWAEYLSIDGGATQATVIGDYTEAEILDIQKLIDTPIFPRITGTTSAEIAAMLAVNDWRSSSTAVFAVVEDSFEQIEITEGSATFEFVNNPTTTTSHDVTVTSSDSVDLTFTPSSTAGWIEGSFDYPAGSTIFTHTLENPNGLIVDYLTYRVASLSRSSQYVETPVPLQFWVPKTEDGTWTLTLSPNSVSSPISLDGTIKHHPGFTQSITVPDNAKWLNVTMDWNNAATDLNMALVDPTGRLGAWAPSGSILSGPSIERVEVSYPMPGEWTVIGSWMDATEENNGVNLSWELATIDSSIQSYLESAGNAAVIASLMNIPLLYVTPNEIPQVTQWVMNQLGVDTSILVDPMNVHSSSLETALSEDTFLSTWSTYSMISDQIALLSGETDVVLSVPLGNGNELFAPAVYSAAVHGAPIFSLCGDDNSLTTRAEETWAPYLIGPEIEIYITDQYATRTENGWYDDRIPNKHSMEFSENSFESFLSDRGAYNSSSSQSIVIVAPTDLIHVSFDRSLQTDFNGGRIPGKTQTSTSVMINRGLLHRFLFSTAENADTSLLTMYAYTNGDQVYDNFASSQNLFQIEESESLLSSAGFTVDMHVGVDAVFSSVASQIGLWSMSTHGTLTLYPTDPPERPLGPGIFSLRDQDASWGFEESLSTRDFNNDGLVNPVAFQGEFNHHVTRSTEDLEQVIGNIGSPIVFLTACLLGGTELPLTLMEHGAVSVTAAPRTVYFNPACYLSVLMTEYLTNGNSTGEALSEGLRRTSIDYANPSSFQPVDYANQQVLFGDPEVHLYTTENFPHVTSIDAYTTAFGDHRPGNGVPSVAALGATSYLPDTLNSLGVEYLYYEATNMSEFIRLLQLSRVTVVEPDSYSTLTSDLAANKGLLDSYVRGGGTFVALGFTGSSDWIPWPLSYTVSTTSSSISIDDVGHPLVSSPTNLGSSIDTIGHFSSVWSNLSILATSNGEPVIVAGAIGAGKLAFTTTHPTGLERNKTLSNVVEWYLKPSLVVDSISLSQYIIWEGDSVTLHIMLSDRSGTPVTSVNLQAWVNYTEVVVTEIGLGLYDVVLDSAWTNGRVGELDLQLRGVKSGYDTLSVVFTGYVFIRPFPWIPILLVGGVFATVIAGYLYMRYRRGDDLIPRRGSKYEAPSAEERKKQQEEDEKFDPKEFFGV
ncbi:MAG: conserved exported protein of unknown function [Candidatus Thorarchaeota archaeon]|nr:MAG: conserved exported protein of unknown function [Candidatus Thorarchaeota archaeon]